MDSFVTLDDKPVEVNQNNLVSLSGGDKFTIGDEVAKQRAARAHFGLGEQSPGEDVIYNSIATGNEDDIRYRVAQLRDVNENQQKLRRLDEMAADGSLTMQKAQDYLTPTKTDPGTVFEKMYSKSFLAMATKDAPVYKPYKDMDPENFIKDTDAAAGIIEKNQITQTIKEDFEERKKQTGWGKTVSDFAEQLVPLLSAWRTGSQLPEALSDSILPGSVLEDKLQYLTMLPPEEYKKKLSEVVTNLADSNIYDAEAFLSAVDQYTQSGKFLDSAMGVADVLDIGGTVVGTGAKVLRRGAKVAAETAAESAARASTYQSKKALRDAVKASGQPLHTLEDVFEGIGDIEKASTISAVKRVTGNAATSTAEEVGRSLPSLYRTESILSDAGTLSREAADRLATRLRTSEEFVSGLLDDPARVGRLGEGATDVAVEQVKKSLEHDFAHVNDSIIDIKPDQIDLNKANVQTVTMELGAPNATLFPTEDMARFYGEHLYGIDPSNFQVAQKGNSFYITVTRPVEETNSSVRAAASIPTNNVQPKGFFEGLFDAVRDVVPDYLAGADNILGKAQSENRKASEFGYTSFLRKLNDLVEPIRVLPKAEQKDLQKVLNFNRDWINPANGERGRYFDTVGQLEDGYMQVHGRLPKEREIEAYYNAIKLNDIDWMVRNLNMYREKSRLGLKRFSFEYRASNLDEANGGAPMFRTTPDFEGREIDDLPWHSAENATVLFYDETAHTPIVFDKNGLDFHTRDYYQNLIKEGGYRVIMVDSPQSRPFKEITNSNELVRFAMVRKYDRNELSWKQLDYNPGGHVDYLHPWMVKQPVISVGKGGQRFYEGDFTMFNFATRAQANKFTASMEQARQLYKAKDAGFDTYVSKNLPYSPESLKKMFDEGTISVEHSFQTVKKGRKVIDDVDLRQQYPNLKDYSNSEYDISGEINRKFSGARNGPLMTIKEKGTDANPHFSLTPAPLVDSLPTLGRALTNATNTRFFGDYKVAAVEDFFNKFADTMKVSKDELLRSPMYYLHNPVWDMSMDNLPKLEKAMAARSAILNFTGQQTMLGRKLENIKSRLLDSVYNFAGDEASRKAFNMSETGLPFIRDPATFIRAAAFHTKMGLFAPVQLLLQAQGLGHIVALSPKQGTLAAMAYPITRWLGVNATDANIAHAAEIMAKMGWKREDFIESMTALRNTGWAHVGKEVSTLDDLADPVVFNRGAVGEAGAKFLDKGLIFFKEGERFIRMTAWNAAYREWKEANPNRAFSKAAERWILDRADTMGLNMTRASQAGWQKGIMSIPTQFFAYQARLADQILGKRLTTAEKTRVMAMYSTLYGVPTAMGAATLYPWYDDIRTAALERGWDVQNGFVKGLLEGFPAVLNGWLGGDEYNVASRYGPGGLKIIKEIANGDKSLAQVLVGASGSITGDIISSASPLTRDVYELFKDGGSFEPVAQDIVDATRNITSVNSAVKVYMAMNTGKYFSKNGTYLHDISEGQALFSGITGLEPMQLSDAYLKSASMKTQRETERAVEKEFSKYFRRGLEAAANGDNDSRDSYWRIARGLLIAGNITPELQGRFLGNALSGYENLVDRIDEQFAKQRNALQKTEEFNKGNQ